MVVNASREYLFGDARASATAVLYCLFSLVTVAFLAFNVPAFQTPDSENHMYRAEILSGGHWIAERREVDGDIKFGGEVSLAIREAMREVVVIAFHRDQKLDRDMRDRLRDIHWDDEKVVRDFRNTASNPPIFYLPQAVGIYFGKKLDLSVERTVFLVRMLDAVCCVLISTVALLIVGKTNLFMFIVLSFPMVSALFASMSQDGLLIATAALASATVLRPIVDDRRMNTMEFAVGVLCLSLVAMARPTYAFLSLIVLVLPAESFRARFAAFLFSVVLSLGWPLTMMLFVAEPIAHPSGLTDQGRQLAYLLANPLVVFAIAGETLGRFFGNFVGQIVGVLGWLDTPLPPLYMRFALALAGLAFLHDALQRRARASWPLLLVCAAALLLSAGAVFGAMYLIWTPVGAGYVEGVQGRYFLPLLVFLPIFVAVGRSPIADWNFERAVNVFRWITIVLFPLVTIAVLQMTVIGRYYLD